MYIPGCASYFAVDAGKVVVGCDYNESTSQGRYRVLASSQKGAGGGKGGAEKLRKGEKLEGWRSGVYLRDKYKRLYTLIVILSCF